MGLIISKRVENTFRTSSEFNSACSAVFAECVSRRQATFTGVRPHQLYYAAYRLHVILFHTVPVFANLVPHSPNRAQLAQAIETLLYHQKEQLNEEEFKEFALEAFAEAAVSSAGNEAFKMLRLGVVGISGFAAVLNPEKDVLAAVIGAYTLTVATSIFYF